MAKFIQQHRNLRRGCKPLRSNFNAVKVGAEADIAIPAELADVVDMLSHAGNIRLTVIRQEVRIEIHPYIAALTNQQAQLVIRQVA